MGDRTTITTSGGQPIDFPFKELSLKVDESVSRAMALLDQYSDPDEPKWDQPEAILEDMRTARDSVREAWEALIHEMQENKKPFVDEDFRVAYMEMITDAFADCLHELQNSDDPGSVGVLVDCLQSGIDLMTQDEKELFMQEHNGELEEMIEGDFSIHDLRREMLGFGTTPTTASTETTTPS